MADPTITICGDLGRDLELRYTSAGKAVVSGRIAHTPKRKDRDTGQWVDGETLWMGFSLWGDQAVNLAASVGKGDRVVVTGKLKARSYLQQGGATRVVQEIDADEVGVSTRWHEVRLQAPTPRPAPAGQVDDYLPNDPAAF